MQIRSLGWQTDVSLRRREGALIEDHEDHLILRTPANPAYRWANFLLLASPPAHGEVERWVDRFQAAFPAAPYLAIGVDSPSGDAGAGDDLIDAGLNIKVDTVLTAQTLRAPRRRLERAELRRAASDADWEAAVTLRVQTAEDGDAAEVEQFVAREMRAIRNVCERGRGAWFGAFDRGKLLASLGIFEASPGVARFQSVDTHPEHRRRGLASSLLFAAGEWARLALGAKTLVIAADPDYFAIDIYRAAGFVDRDHKVSISRL